MRKPKITESAPKPVEDSLLDDACGSGLLSSPMGLPAREGTPINTVMKVRHDTAKNLIQT